MTFFPKLLSVENENALTALAGESAEGCYYIDFSAVSEDHDWSGILSEKQRITALNVTGIILSKAFYTMEITPEDTFDGMILLDEVPPATLDF